MSKHSDRRRCLKWRKKHAKKSHVAGFNCCSTHKNVFSKHHRRHHCGC